MYDARKMLLGNHVRYSMSNNFHFFYVPFLYRQFLLLVIRHNFRKKTQEDHHL